MNGCRGPEPAPSLPWLSELDRVVEQLNRNVASLACVDASPGLVFDIAASRAMRGAGAAATLGEVGRAMVAAGFDAVKAMTDREAALLTERCALLHTIRETLTEHRADYRAHLDPDDDDAAPAPAAEPRARRALSGLSM
jgi:hypothetical protein